MKRGSAILSFLVIFLLLLIPNAYAIYEELAYSGTIEDGDIVEIAGKEFEFKVDSKSNKVFIEIDVSGIIIESGNCEIKDNLDICIKNVSFSYRNYTTYYEVYKAEISVYQIKSKLDVSNTIGKNNLLIDEETTAELSFENTADITTKNVVAIVNIPPNILVTDVEGCKLTLNEIMFQGDVSPRQVRKCIYKLKGLEPGDFEFSANVTYFDGLEDKSEISDRVNGKVYNYSLQINYQMNDSTFKIGKEFDIIVDAININEEYAVTVTTFSIKIPDKLLILSRPKDTQGTDKLISWSGTLQPKENRSFKVGLQSLTTDKYSIATSASYKIEKFLRKTQKDVEIEVKCDCPFLEHEFSQQIVVPEQRAVLKANIANPGLGSFKNVKIDYVTDIPGIQDYSTAYNEINPGEKIGVFDSSIIAPQLGETYYLNITVSYESIGNQVFIVKDNIPIRVPYEGEDTPKETQEEFREENQEVSLETEEIEEEINSTQEKGEEKEIIVTKLEEEEKNAFLIYVAITITFLVFFILVIQIVFRRRKRKKIENPPYLK